MGELTVVKVIFDDWSKNIVKIETKLDGIAGDADAAERRWAAEFRHVLAGDALKPRTIPPRNSMGFKI